MRCIGIDIGSSSIKGAVLDIASGRLEHMERAPFPDPVPGLPAGFHEVRVDAIVAGAREVVASLLRHAPDARQLRVSSQMGGLVLLDARGAALTHYLSWRDQRAMDPAPGATAPLPALRSMSSGLGYSLAGLEGHDLLGCNFGAVPGVMGSIGGLGSSLFGSSMDSAGLGASSALLSAPERVSLSHPQHSPRHHIRASSLHESHVSMGSHVSSLSGGSLRSPATARTAHEAPNASTLVSAVVSATEGTAAELQSYAPFARRPALEPPDAAYSPHESSFESAQHSAPSFGSFSSLSRPADLFGIDEVVNPVVEEDYRLWLADDY